MDGGYDVIVIGGGAAGLSGAVALGRARRRVLVIDSGQPRNAPAAHVHNFLTRDGRFALNAQGQLTDSSGNLVTQAGGQPIQVDPTTVVQQGMIETANVDAIQQMTRMISVSRAYEQVTSMMDATGTASDQSIQRLGRVN